MSATQSTSAADEIVITRVFNAPRTLVYRAWTDPVHLARWWGPRCFTNPRCEADARPGGTIRIDMQAPDGTIYAMSGIYLELIEPEQITLTTGALDEKGSLMFEFLHVVTFQEKAGKTTLTIRSRVVKIIAPDSAKYIGGFEAGMTQSLEKLAEDFMNQNEPFIIERTFNAPISFVWRALTDKDDFKHWYFDLPEFKAEVGFEFQFVVEHNGHTFDHRCCVTEVVPGKKIAYTWRYHGHEGISLVTFELFQEGNNQTRLKLTHTGLETFPKTDAFLRSNFERGWTQIIGTDLKQYVEKQDNENPLRPV